MSHQILQFQGNYYEYKGANADDPGLTIGGFESAFCSDIVVVFLLDKLQNKVFKNIVLRTKKGNRWQNFIYNKMYRDDRILVTEKTWSPEMFEQWLNKFQENVNKLLNSDKLCFTLVVWDQDFETINPLPDNLTYDKN